MRGHFETEHKWLIRMPDVRRLSREPGCIRWDIVQTYLASPNGVTERVRSIGQDGQTRYVHTVKRRVSVLTSTEDERDLSPEEYAALLERADPARRAVEKTRYRIPWKGRLLEIDIYPFWEDRAILEIEVDEESESVSWPEWLEVVREVTGDGRYRNARLAAAVPMDDISGDT